MPKIDFYDCQMVSGCEIYILNHTKTKIALSQKKKIARHFHDFKMSKYQFLAKIMKKHELQK